MSTEAWDQLLRELADDPSEYAQEGGEAIFTRQGQEHVVSLREIPGAGVSVEVADDSGRSAWVPLHTYAQRDVLGLPRLASQIIRTLERIAAKRPGQFIEGPAVCEIGLHESHWDEASINLREFLARPEPGSTRLLQLMAPAGQGKTVLLENSAVHLARNYQPDPHPTPILLTVDLLGRFVGTIEDAIAGSLNNTYLFPGLSQRDVSLAIRNRWLVLALDGFDELTARVGVREAFLRITELLEQLRQSGTVILSARESFFELYQVSSAIRSYLQPKKGSYSTSIVRLLPWKQPQGYRVFEGVGSAEPESDLMGLLTSFEQDTEIVLHPFFLTRLADLWMRGERFSEASGQPDHLARTRYVIETFVQRESGEKWIDRDGNPLIPATAHSDLLGGIAEEMWRSGAFSLDVEELRLAAELGVSHLNLVRTQVEAVIERVPTHAALTTRGRGFSFLHERFLHFFLGHRLVRLLKVQDAHALGELMAARELPPSVMEWVAWRWRESPREAVHLIPFLEKLRDSYERDSVGLNSIALLCAELLKGLEPPTPLQVRSFEFVGAALMKGCYRNLHFQNCRFWHADLRGTSLRDCRFDECEFGDVLVDGETSFANSLFNNSKVASIELEEEGFFAPAEIAQQLERLGALLSPSTEQPMKRIGVTTEATHCVETLVRASERTCDVGVEELEEVSGRLARSVVRIALDSGVVRKVSKQVSGPRKRFVRFTVDRDVLLRGQAERTGDPRIDEFWEALRTRHSDPRR